MKTERAVYVCRVASDLIPQAYDDVRVLNLPASLKEVLDQGWSVVNHQMAFPTLDGDAILTLYAERDA